MINLKTKAPMLREEVKGTIYKLSLMTYLKQEHHFFNTMFSDFCVMCDVQSLCGRNEKETDALNMIIKRKIEDEFPNTLLVMSFPTHFNKHSQRENPIMTNLAIFIDEEAYQSAHSIQDKKDQILDMSIRVKNRILELLNTTK